MKTITQSEYFGSQINPIYDKDAKLNLYQEGIVNGNRITLIQKNLLWDGVGIFGVDTFHKNGKSKDWFSCKNYEDAKNIFNILLTQP